LWILVNADIVGVLLQLSILGSCLYSWWKQNGMLIVMHDSTFVLAQMLEDGS
jgi:hypothetical protein